MGNDPLLPLRKGEEPYRGKEVDSTKFLRLAVVSRVDYETGYVDLNWLEGAGMAPLVRAPLQHGSLRSSIRAMPEEGSVVICGWGRQSQTWEEPIILGFVDLNLEQLLDYRLIRTRKTSDDLKEIKEIREKIGYDVTRGKRRKIYPGEIQLESTQGAELNLDDDVYLSDSKLNEIEIRSADKSIRLSSSQMYTVTQASRTWNGMVTREPGESDYSFQPTVLPNGQKIQIVTDSHNPTHVGGKAFTEHRIEMYDLVDGIMKATEINAGYDVNPLAPFLSYVMGTLVGNDKSDSAKYAKVLRPQVFGVPSATEVALDYLECMPEEYTSLASMLHFSQPSSRVQIDVDKEGHLFTFFPASSARHPLGAGRSWEAAFDGSVKLVIGAENVETKSLFLDTKGGIQANLGIDKNGKSSIITTQKGVELNVMAPANDGRAYFLNTKGDYEANIDGNCKLTVTGNYTISVRGKFKVESLATKEESYVNDKNNLYGGSYKKIVIKDKQEQIGYDRDIQITGNLERAGGVFTPALPGEAADKLALTFGSRDESYLLGNLRRSITAGNKTTSVIAGNIQEDIKVGSIKRSVLTGSNETSVKVGNIKEDIITGNSTESITTGNKSITIKAGKFSVSVNAGNVEINTTTGKINLNSLTQTVDINGQLTVSIKSGVKLKLSGPQVEIGLMPTKGGVVTGLPGIPTHMDYLTGTPLIGSKTVKSSV